MHNLHSSLDPNPSADWPALYDELRRLAAVFLERERPEHTLQPTALVNEAFVRLSGQVDASIAGRVAFLGAAANTMRRVLVDHARGKKCQKRGGSEGRLVPLDMSLLAAPNDPVDCLVLDEALERLGRVDPRLARLVELRYFAGMNEEEAAAVLGVSRRTVQTDWRAARAWLRRELMD